MIIYKATNIINGKCYIGQTVKGLDKRTKRHKLDSEKVSVLCFHRAIRKYGWDNFSWEVLCQCETKEELDEMEFHYIKQCHSHKSEYGYNLTWGGDGCYGLSCNEETRKKISKSLRGRNKGCNNPFFGKKHSQEACKKMSKNNRRASLGDNSFAKKVSIHGHIFSSIIEVATYLDISRRTVWRMLSTNTPHCFYF